MRHLTRIVGVPFGVNILGLLEIFAFVGVPSSLIAHYDTIPQWLARLCAGGVIVTFELWWRRRQIEASWWARLLSPFAGGCFAFVPVWLFVVAGTLVALIRNFS